MPRKAKKKHRIQQQASDNEHLNEEIQYNTIFRLYCRQQLNGVEWAAAVYKLGSEGNMSAIYCGESATG